MAVCDRLPEICLKEISSKDLGGHGHNSDMQGVLCMHKACKFLTPQNEEDKAGVGSR